MDIKAVAEYVAPQMSRVMDLVRSSLESDIDLLNKTNEVMLGSGKRIRPMLSILMALAISKGLVTDDTIRFAAASELLHNATLLHDDVVDNSPVRRGAPTVMSILGGSASVLLGDYWLVKAMDRILEARSNSARVIRIFAKTLSDLAEGEMLQMQKASDGDTSESDYLRIIYSKTASLFEASALSAAISVGASESMRKAASVYACNIGTAFQIRDDMLDYMEGNSTGKPAGQDLDEQKITLPLLGAMRGDPSREAEIRALVRGISDNPSAKASVMEYVRTGGGMEYAAKKLEGYVSMAIFSLREFPEGPARDALETLARYIGGREE
ncbi:MAG: polyprenyl synthetase family protein [Bacteroidales bacterium]|nr:polyprenyl synthetase family protein [Bacteroidales bacterium]